MGIDISGGINGITVESDPTALKLTGGTLSGKLTATTTATTAGVNLGFGTTAPTSVVAGDIFITDRMQYVNRLGNLIGMVSTNQTSTIATSSAANILSIDQNGTGGVLICRTLSTSAAGATLRVENRGVGASFIVEDTTTVDTDAFVITSNGSVGVGVSASAFTPTSKFEIVGDCKATSFNAGTGGVNFSDQTRLTTSPVSPNSLKYFDPAWVSNTVGAGATALNVFGNQRVVGPSSDAGYASRGHPLSLLVRGVNPDNGAINFSKRIAWGFRIARYSFGTTSVDSVLRVVLGRGTVGGDPTTKSIGVSFNGTSNLNLIVHDGTTLTTVTTTFMPVHLQSFDCYIVSEGNGVVTLFVNGTQVATTTLGPTGNGVGTPNHSVEAQNIAPLAVGTSTMGAYYCNHTIEIEP